MMVFLVALSMQLSAGPVATRSGFAGGPARAPVDRGQASRAGSSEWPLDLHDSRELCARYGIEAGQPLEGLLHLTQEHPEWLRERIRQSFLGYLERPMLARVELAEQSRVDAFTGAFASIHLTLKDAVYEGILVSRARIQMDQVIVDVPQLLLADKLRFKHLGRTQFFVDIGQREINRYLFASGRDLHDIESPRLELHDGSMRVSARVHSPLGWTHVRVDGRFEVAEGTRINFVASGLKLGALPVPGVIARTLFDRLNPVADLARLNLRVKPDLIVSRPGRLFVLTRGMEHLMDETGGPR